jgi:dTDP-4-amino-4,6-dideoxygalactose transaminase
MITRTASDPIRFASRLWFTNRARTAFRLILETLRISPGSSILVPAYIGVSDREGSGLWDPVVATSVPASFYAVDELLAPDHDALEARLASGRHPLLLVVHYFGFVRVDLPRLTKACHRHGVMLVEDCAHVPFGVFGEGGPGSYGDAAFYSLHKTIAVPTGGVLWLNNETSLEPTPLQADRCDPGSLEQLVRTDLPGTARKRRENYRWLSERLRNVDGLTILYPELRDEVPHDFPICVHDGLREKLYWALMSEEAPTIALYYRLIDAIPPDEFPVSHRLSQNILNLPVHQDTDIADLERLTDVLKAALRRLKADLPTEGSGTKSGPARREGKFA